jgi:uncharacterized protein YjbI with pentapeptide repeats
LAFKDAHGAHRTAGIPVVGTAWRDTEIRGDDVAGVVFQNCVLERVRLVETNLWQTMFVDTRFEDCEFVDCRLFRTQWVQCSGTGLRITGGEFSEAVFSECRFGDLAIRRAGDRIVLGTCAVQRLAFDDDGCRQTGLTVSECTFDAVAAENAAWTSASAVAVDFAGWSIDGSVFEQCMFVQSSAAGRDLSNVRFDKCNLFKSDFREARVRSAPGSIFAECDCADADFRGAELDGALFAKTSAPKARFTGASLTNAMFPGAVLVGADFSQAVARQSVWTGADLADADLSGADAYRASFRNARLDGALMQGARLVEADLHGVDASLDGADVRDARGTTGWRSEREREARHPPPER